jgi:cbb3-type cytochrome oxidase subunit 3
MDIVSLMQWLVQYSIVPVLVVFVLVLVSTYLPSRKPEMERNARIPFDDDDR